MRELGIPHEKLNVNGGAVALGHPIGCSGARVLTTLMYAMKDRGAKRGLATLCLGGGNAVSMIVERPESPRSCWFQRPVPQTLLQGENPVHESAKRLLSPSSVPMPRLSRALLLLRLCPIR